MADSTIFCSQCGTSNLSSARFCQKCGGTVVLLGTGAAVAPSAPSPMTPPSPYAGRPMPPIPAGVPVQQAMMVSPYGGFWMRFLAVILDSILVSVVTTPIIFLVAGTGIAAIIHLGDNPAPEQVLPIVMPMIAILFPVIFGINWLYEALATSSKWEGTLGKKMLGLKVTDISGRRIGFGRATGRHFAKFLSSMFLNIGYIMAAFTDKKQGLHDLIAGTLVVKR